MKRYTFSIEIDGNQFHFEYMNGEVFYLPYGRKEISTYSLNYGRIEVPQIWIITRKSGCPLFALEPTEADENKFDIMTAQYLYDEYAVQWFEPLADKYRRLIWVNPRCLETGTEEYEAYKHFTWQDIIDFALINRPSSAYAKYASGDWKFVADGGDKYLLVMVGNKPYWADAIGQIPFAVDTMRLYLEKYEGDVSKAIKKTSKVGIWFSNGSFKPEYNNVYDHYFVLRGALYGASCFNVHIERAICRPDGSKITEVTIQGNGESRKELLELPINKLTRAEYGMWKYSE